MIRHAKPLQHDLRTIGRRQFGGGAVGTLAAGVVGACARAGAGGAAGAAPPRAPAAGAHGRPRAPNAASEAPSRPLDAAAFRASRCFAELSFGKIAYVERGSGDAA